MKRFWDPKDKYAEGFIKEYDFWSLEVSFRQHTPGCYILFSKEKVEKISELSTDALKELKIVTGEVEAALLSIPELKPDRFNYLQLGNGLHHLHIHGIPRYSSSRTFLGREWGDTNWGHPPVWIYDEVTADLVRQIKEKIKNKLGV